MPPGFSVLRPDQTGTVALLTGWCVVQPYMGARAASLAIAGPLLTPDAYAIASLAQNHAPPHHARPGGVSYRFFRIPEPEHDLQQDLRHRDHR